jgi:hypothetical protein
MRITAWMLNGVAGGILMTTACSSSSSLTNSPQNWFVDNANGTVTDTQSGLIWLKNANCFGQMSWTDAEAAVNSLQNGQCGLTDGSTAGQWRLPTLQCVSGAPCNITQQAGVIGEFATILVPACGPPFIPNTAGTGCWAEGDPFAGVQSDFYWSAISDAGSPNATFAWVISLLNGAVSTGSKAGVHNVWPVRGGA